MSSSSGLLLVDFFFLGVSFFGLAPLPPDLSLSSSFFLEDDDPAAALVAGFSPSLTDFDGPATSSILTGI